MDPRALFLAGAILAALVVGLRKGAPALNALGSGLSDSLGSGSSGGGGPDQGQGGPATGATSAPTSSGTVTPGFSPFTANNATAPAYVNTFTPLIPQQQQIAAQVNPGGTFKPAPTPTAPLATGYIGHPTILAPA